VIKEARVFQANKKIPSSIPSAAPVSKTGKAYERRLVEISNIVSGAILRILIKKIPTTKLKENEMRYAKINLAQAL
jgi:hypothetical protein